MRKVCAVVLAGMMVFALGLKAEAAIIVDQSGSYTADGRVAQVFPDLPGYTSFEFDDFSIDVDYYIDTLSVYGQENGWTDSTNVVGEIWNNLPGSFGGSVVMSSVSGAQVGSNLLIDFGGQVLPAGSDYWVTAYISRPSTGGQWFWYSTGAVTNGSQSYFYNPGNSFGYGSEPVTGDIVFSLGGADMAFLLEGREAGSNVVPEPSTMLLFGLGSLSMAALKRKKRSV